MKQGIHPDYHEVVFLDSATGYKFLSGSTKTSSETIEWEDGKNIPIDSCRKSLVIHIRSTQVSKSLRKQMVAWIVSTRSTVSQNKTINENSQVFGLRTLGCFHVFSKISSARFKKRLKKPRLRAKRRFLKYARKMQPSVTGKMAIFEICP